MKHTMNSFKVLIGIGLIIAVVLAGIVLFRAPISNSIQVAQAPRLRLILCRGRRRRAQQRPRLQRRRMCHPLV